MIRRALEILLGGLLAGAAPATAEWREATSRHFVLYGDTSEANLRRQADALERLDWGLRRFMRVEEEPEIAARKVTVYLVGDGDVQRLCRCKNVGGFYFSNVSGSTAFSGSGDWADREGTRLVLFHEYAHHFLLGSYSLAFPSWFTEGFAEFASTAKVEAEQISIGHAANHRAYGLFVRQRLTATQMLDPGLRGRLRPDQMDSFYGRGWLLTHFMMFEPGRFEHFSRYVAAINRGTPATPAAQQAFGDLKALDQAVERYLNRPRLFAAFLKYAEAPPPVIRLRTLRAGEAALIDERMQSVRGVDLEDARKLFARAAPVAARYADDPVVQGWLAEMAFDAGDDAAAEAAATRALAKDAKSVQALMYRARVKLRRLEQANSTDAAAWAAARQAVVLANRADPDDAEPLWWFWRSFTMERKPPSASSLKGLYRAQELMPQDNGVRFAAATARIMAGEGDEAKRLLRPLAYHPHAPADNPGSRMLAALDAGKKGAEVLAAGASNTEAAEKEDGKND